MGLLEVEGAGSCSVGYFVGLFLWNLLVWPKKKKMVCKKTTSNRIEAGKVRVTMSGMKRALRQFTFGSGKTAGRNSSGRITSFHRGGGAKRLQRTIDLKRNTSSSVGVVERIEYDPNRSSRIALVRWLNGIRQPQPRTTTSTTSSASPRVLQFDPSSATNSGDNNNNNVPGVFAFNSMLPETRTNSGDVFLSAFSSKAKERKFDSVSLPLGLPRIAVAAARPTFFATRVKGEEMMQIRNWKKNSDVWAHKNKRKAAISWHCNA